MLVRCLIPIIALIVVAASSEIKSNNISSFSAENVTKYDIPPEDSKLDVQEKLVEQEKLVPDSGKVELTSEKESSPKKAESEYMRNDDDDDRLRSKHDGHDDEREGGDSRRSRRGDDDGDDDDDDGDNNNGRHRRRIDRNGHDKHGGNERSPDFKHCGGSAIRLHVHKFPSPLLLREGEKLRMAFTAVVTERIPEPIYARISIRKKVLGLWSRIPCVGRVGSCEYEVTCNKIKKQAGGRMNQPCPPPVGKTQREFTFTMPKIPRIVRNFASGRYKIEARLFTKKKKRGELLACSETQVRVKT